MTHAHERPPHGLLGQESPANSSEHPTLDVETGAWGDHRAALEPHHPHYAAAWLAWKHQDKWTDDEHAEHWRLLLTHWPRRRGPHTDRDERAYIVWFLHYGHGVPLEALAEKFGYTPDALYRMAVAGREAAPRLGDAPTRVPMVFAHEAEKPRRPYRVTVAQRPHRFDWDHPRPMAFRWTDEHGCQQLVLPLDNRQWEQIGPTTFRVPVMRTGTVYLAPDDTPFEVDQRMLQKIAASYSESGEPIGFSVIAGG